MNPTKYHEEGKILFMSSINFLLFPDGTWPVIGEGISYQRTLTPLPTTSNNEHDKKLFSFCQKTWRPHLKAQKFWALRWGAAQVT